MWIFRAPRVRQCTATAFSSLSWTWGLLSYAWCPHVSRIASLALGYKSTTQRVHFCVFAHRKYSFRRHAHAHMKNMQLTNWVHLRHVAASPQHPCANGCQHHAGDEKPGNMFKNVRKGCCLGRNTLDSIHTSLYGASWLFSHSRETAFVVLLKCICRAHMVAYTREECMP